MAYIGDDAVEVEPVSTDNIGSLASLVISELPGCDDILVRMKLGAALREFCRETNACTVVIPGVVGDKGMLPVPAAPNGMVVGAVLNVKNSKGYAVAFDVDDGYLNKIVLRGANEGDRVFVKISVYPKAGGEACPEWFIERFAEDITAGAMNKLLSMTGRPWSDPQRAAAYGAEFADAISEASYRSLGSQLGGGAESSIPQGGLFI